MLTYAVTIIAIYAGILLVVAVCHALGFGHEENGPRSGETRAVREKL